MREWKLINKRRSSKIDDIIKTLLINRGLRNKKHIEEFLNPPDPSTLNPILLGIKKDQLLRAVKRIKSAIKNGEQIVVYGDYDVDGICGSAILWETLNGLSAKVMPYIPHRVEEGYGLSVKGIQNILSEEVGPPLRSDLKKTRVIITVDNGIVAREAVEFANKNGIDVIITDHHLLSKKLPRAYAIVHTTKLCGAGVAWVLARQCHSESAEGRTKNPKRSFAFAQDDSRKNSHLELVALATIADLVPLLGPNRTLTKYGLEVLRETKRAGLVELFKEAGLAPQMIGVYEVGHIISPRLNAMGRIEHAMDSLRLLCTKDVNRARELAQKLGAVNRERQQLTEETTLHAKSTISKQQITINKLIFIAHESYQQGVIGLVAGRLVDEFYRPSIVISKGKTYSKASARSINGFNIIEFIRSAEELLVDAGGHPMAAGFTVETRHLEILKERLTQKIEEELSEEKLARTLRIDYQIDLADITEELYKKIQEFRPFGMANPEPTFVSRQVTIEDMWLVGNDGKHLKLRLSCHPERSEGSRDSSPANWRTQNDKGVMDAIAFGMGERAREFRIGDVVDIVFTIDEDRWLAPRSLGEVGNENSKLQLKIKDIKKN